MVARRRPKFSVKAIFDCVTGVPALQKLISETTPIKSGSKTTKSYEKRGNYYTALRDLFSVVDSKVVRERKTGNGVS